MASLYGWNPLKYLGLAPSDRQIAAAVLRERIEIEEDRTQRYLSFVAHENAAHICNWLAKAF